MSSNRTTLHPRLSSHLFIRKLHLFPHPVGFHPRFLTTGQSTQPLIRGADIQTSATGGDVADQTSIQSRRVSTVTESLPVEDTTDSFRLTRRGNSATIHYIARIQLCTSQERDTGSWRVGGGDHSVEFLVDSGSSVTAISDVLYGNLLQAGAPVGALQATARTLRSANGTGIEVLGCSRCSVSFWDCERSSPIIICSLAAGTDAIIGTDVLGSVLPHTLDIKNGLYLRRVGRRYSYTGGIRPCRVACSRWVIRQYRHIRRLSYTALSGPLVVAHCHLVACWRD